ncbi:glycosyltransferase involved in cell wall biosynthesis [Sphingomonas naasensis]|uniref:Glycosyltransferase family 4 protein n=1 Tax=Sphingomonas naasensis TaxID=1344951 RepID=A0A4S1WQV0_9SPHN|nr:glycosyltransferase involved in cell wall biosynthesis [Sphingomonas naasensis]TGX45738.1 glycosyltransferase family 4 protein [Sphingomonas naasensis]
MNAHSPQQRILAGSQLAAFSHRAFVSEQVADFLAICPVSGGVVVDLGGGCGHFGSALAGQRPDITPRVVDLDQDAIACCAAAGVEAEHADAITYRPRGDETAACFNLVLHHLVGADEAATRQLQLSALRNWAPTHTPVFVNEYAYDSWFGDTSARLIYAITSSPKLSSLCAFIGKFCPSLRANTLGVGVRFRSRKGWEELFREAGFRVQSVRKGYREEVSLLRRLLLIRSVRRVSFTLVGKKQRLLLVNESLGGGGAERQLCHLANELTERGHAVAVATWASPEVADCYELLPGIARFHLRRHELHGGKIRRALTMGRSWLRLLSLIRREKPETIISFSDVSNIMCVAAAKLMGLPAIVSIRNNPDAWMKPHWHSPAIWAYRRAAVVVQTGAVADWCRARDINVVSVIPNMIHRVPELTKPRERLIVAVGSLQHRKGHDLLIRAFAKADALNPGWRLALLGQGPELDPLRQLANELGVGDRVEFRGFVVNVHEAMARASIFALPSRFEGLPNALLEAMALGLPCVAADCDYGPRSVITDGHDGMLVPVGDIGALGDALAQLMGDPAKRAHLAGNAPNVRCRFHANRITARWREAIAGQRGGLTHSSDPLHDHGAVAVLATNGDAGGRRRRVVNGVGERNAGVLANH